MAETNDRWEPTPVPKGDGRHDIGDEMRAAIVERLISDWSRDPDLSPEKVRQLAMWAGASVRALMHEIGTLRDSLTPSAGSPETPEVLLERLITQAFVSGQMDAQATELEKWKTGRGGTIKAHSTRTYELAQETAGKLRASLAAPPVAEEQTLSSGIPDHICGMCYHQLDRCSHCDQAAEEQTPSREWYQKRCEWYAKQVAEEPATIARLRDIAADFVMYYTRRGGCSNCGGLPHSTTCFVGLFESALNDSERGAS